MRAYGHLSACICNKRCAWKNTSCNLKPQTSEGISYNHAIPREAIQQHKSSKGSRRTRETEVHRNALLRCFGCTSTAYSGGSRKRTQNTQLAAGFDSSALASSAFDSSGFASAAAAGGAPMYSAL